jgi:hypothetical protein
MTLSPAIGGIRVSTDQQADRYGPDRQRDDITREAQRVGLAISQWVEESISGTDHDRAEVNAYYTLARQHPGANFFFSHPNRVGRHVEVTVGIARTIHALGGTVWIAGTGSLRDRKNWRNFLRDAVEAENDFSDIVERLQRGKYDKAARNRWPHGAPPYGYRLVRDERGKSLTIEPVPELAAVVRSIFDMALGGLGSATIAANLIRSGVAAPRVKLWSHRIILYILGNESYAGRRLFTGPNGETAIITFPALITVQEYAEVKRAVSSRQRERPARTKRPALFAGHMRCTLCGGGMTVVVSRDRKGQARYIYYRCRNAYSGSSEHAVITGGKICSHGKLHRTDNLDTRGWELFVASMTDPLFLGQATRTETLELPDHAPRIAEIKAQMTQAVQRAITHNLPEDVLQAAIAPLQLELAQLQKDLRAPVREDLPDMTALADALADYLPTLETLEERRSALDTWTARLHVGLAGPEKLTATVLNSKKLL